MRLYWKLTSVILMLLRMNLYRSSYVHPFSNILFPDCTIAQTAYSLFLSSLVKSFYKGNYMSCHLQKIPQNSPFPPMIYM